MNTALQAEGYSYRYKLNAAGLPEVEQTKE